jgi:hypothetical protein
MPFSNLSRERHTLIWIAFLSVAACRAESGRARAETRDIPEDSGTVCVEKLPAFRPLDEYYGKRPRAGSQSEFRIILDDADTLSIRPGMGGDFGKLKDSTRHRVRIFMDGKPREDFHFDFRERGSMRLCLYYRKSYGTWSLEPADWRRKTCACPP